MDYEHNKFLEIDAMTSAEPADPEIRQKPVMELDSTLKRGVFYNTFIMAGSAVKLPKHPRPHLVCHPDTWAEQAQSDKDQFEVIDGDELTRQFLEKFALT